MLTKSYSNYQIRELVPEALITLDAQDCFIYINQIAGDMLNRKPEELLGKHIWTEFPEAVTQPVYTAYKKATESKQHVYMEEFNEAHDRWFENHIYQSPGGTSICFSDITERKKTESLFQSNELRYKAFFENSMDGVILGYPDGTIYAANAAACRIFERTEEEICLLGRAGLLDTSDPRLKKIVEERKQKGEAEGESAGLKKDGTKFPVGFRTKLFTDSKGKEHAIVIMRDNSELSKAKNKIKEQEFTLNSLINSFSNAVFSLDTKYCYTSFNRAYSNAMKMLYGKEIVLGGCLLDDQTKEDVMVSKPHLDRALAGESFSAEGYVGVAGLAQLYIEVFHNPILNEEGKVIGISIEAKDNTAKKRAEEALNESEALYRSILNASPDDITITDLQGTILMISPSALPIWGYQHEDEILGRSVSEFVVPEDVGRIYENISLFYNGVNVNPGLYTGLRKDKSSFPVEVNADFIRNSDGEPVKLILSIRDITERKRAEQALIDSENKYRELVENSPYSIAVYQEGKVVFVNNETVRLMAAVTKAELIGKPVLDFIHPDYHSFVTERMKKAAAEGVILPMAEEKFINLAGTEIDVEVKALPIMHDNKPAVQLIVRDITESKKAELLKQEAVDRLLKISSRIPGVIYQYRLRPDGTSCFPYASDNIKDIYQINPEDVKEDAARVLAIIHPDDLLGVMNSIQESAKSLSPWNYEYRVKFPDNGIHTLYGNAIPQLEADGSILWHGYISDITERKIQEEAIRESEEKWRKLVTSVPDFIALHDLDAKFTFLNHYAEGFSEKDVSGKTLYDFVSEESKEGYRLCFEKCIQTNQKQEFLYYAYGDNYTIRTYESYLVPVTDKENTVVSVMAIARDITDRKLSEEAVITKAEQLERTGEIAKVGGWEFDLRTKKRSWSKETCRILELDPPVTPEFDTNLNYSFYLPGSLEKITAAVDDGIVSGRPYDMELQMITAKGRSIWVREQGAFLMEEGKPVKLYGVIQDITERKKTEEALRSAHQSYFDIFNSSSEAIYILDETGTFINVNKGAEEMYLFTKEEMIGQTPASVAAPGLNNLEEIQQMMQSVTETGIAVQFDFWALRKNGEVFPKEVIVNRGSYFDKQVLIATARDITERKRAETEIKESEERYRSIITASPDGVAITDLEGRIQMASPVSVKMFGLDNEDEVKGQLITDFVFAEDRPFAFNNIALMFQGIMTGLGQYRAVRKDGTVFYMEANAEFIRNAEGNPAQMVFIVRDVNMRKQAEQQLKESEHFLNETQSVSKIGSYKLDITEGLWESSLVLRNIFGIEANGRFGIDLWESFIHPDYKEEMHTYLVHEVFGKKQRFDKEYKVVNQLNGKEYWVHGIGDLELDENGLPAKMIGTIQDITEKKEAEDLLHAKEKLFRALIENGNDGVVILNAWGVFKYIAPSIKSVLGYDEDELLNTSLLDITHPDDYDKSVEIYKEVLASEGLYTPEFIPRIKHKNGEWRWISGAMNNLINDAVVHGIIGNFRDVTDRVLNEQAIRESEIRYRSLIDNAGDAIAIYDKEGKVLDVNTTGLNLLGFSKEEILKKKVTDFFLREEIDAIPITYNNLQPGESTLRQRNFISKDGTLVLTEVRSQMLPDGNYLSIVRDLTERIQAQENLRREKELSDSIISRLPGIFYLYDEEGHFIRWNKNFEKISGYSKEEIKKMQPVDFYGKKHHYIISNRINSVFDKESPGSEVELLTKQGTKIPFYINSFTIDYEGKRCLTGIGIDLTAKRKAEQEIAEKTAQLENLSDNLPDTMMYQVVLETDGRIHFTYLSKAIERVIGKTADEVIGNSVLLYEMILEEDRERLAVAERISFLTMSVMDIDVRMRTAKGDIRWTNLRSVPRKDSDGRIIWDGVLSDITERKYAEERLRISDENYSSLVNTIEGIVWEADAKTTQFNFVSKQAEQILGYPAEQWIAEKDFWPNHLHEADRHWAINYCAKYTSEKKSHDFEYRMIAADGRIVWLHDIVTVVVEDNKPVKIRGLMIDITEKKIIEKGLEDYKFALNQSSIVDVSDRNGTIQYANENFCRISGYSLEELKGEDHKILKSGYHSQEHYKNLWDTVTGGKVWRAEVKNKAKDGSFYWVDSTIIPFLDDNGKPFQFITIRSDITKRKEAETQILNTLERYDILSKATSDTIWDWDVPNNVIVYNQGIVKNFGYKATKVKNVKEWWDTNIHPEDRRNVQEEFEKAFQKRKAVVQVEYRYRSAGGNYRYILDRAFIMYGANKKPERMIGSMQDITNEKEIAIRIEKEVIDAQEREWNQIGMELHDNVNQILAASMLLMGLGKEKMERGQNAASIINESEKHVGEAIAEIRRLSHQLAPVSVDNLSLEQVFESLIETVNVNKQIKVKLQMKGMKEVQIPHKLQINLYRILQEQLNNIMKHAKATEVIISFKKVKHSFVFKIADNGRGFDPEAHTNGIGLENIKRRAKVFAGEFKLKAAPGKGCEITVEIPENIFA